MILNKSNYNKLFEKWLLTSIILILIMVIVGGLTRITESGLSITNWELFKGVFPPVTQNQWDEYFALYKLIPQYKLINNSITLSEFKVIFYWEYFHRLLGRIIGLFYLLPLLFFTFKNVIKKEYIKHFYLIFFIICFQGFIGWYMVESGLTNLVSVSHYRLALHLIIAFIITSIIYWNYLNIKNETEVSFLNRDNSDFLIKIYFFLILFQIIFGAFVSGLDAGKIYQTWPLMNNSLYPDDITFFLDLNNQSAVQFLHRNIAYLIFFYSLFLFWFFSKTNFIKYYRITFYLLLIQIILGILTLISGLNNYLAIFHQITSILLLLSILNLNFRYNAKKTIILDK